MLFAAILFFQILVAVMNMAVATLIMKKFDTKTIKILGHSAWSCSSINLILLAILSNISLN